MGVSTIDFFCPAISETVLFFCYRGVRKGMGTFMEENGCAVIDEGARMVLCFIYTLAFSASLEGGGGDWRKGVASYPRHCH